LRKAIDEVSAAASGPLERAGVRQRVSGTGTGVESLSGMAASRRSRVASLRVTGSAMRSRSASYPGFIEPCHPTERERPPSGANWIHEIKADGYRAQLHVRDGKVIIYSRRGHDWTAEFAPIARAAEALPVRHAVLDGEAISQDEHGLADFHALRRQLAHKGDGNLTYYAFDLLYLEGEDLRPQPLLRRKQKLKRLVAKVPRGLLYADHLEADAEEIYRHACKMGLEGIVSKRRDSPYRSGRQQVWLKIKCSKSGMFPIIAFVEKLGANPRRMASFYIGRWDNGRLLYAGKVQTGFTQQEARVVRERLDRLIRNASPLDEPISKPKATWVSPKIEAEVVYRSLTEHGLLREPVYKGLRNGLQAPPRPRGKPARTSSGAGVPRENILQRLPDAETPSKGELAAYWRTVAKRALPYLANRPLKLVRHTRGTTFYHKGPLPLVPDAVRQLRIEKREGGEGIRLWVDDLAGLLGLIEIGVVEVHPWSATVDDYEHADQLVFDLDPGDGVAWDTVIESAVAMRRLLEGEGLESWPKTTGGKGLHVVAPLPRRITHDAAHDYAKQLARRLAASHRDRYVALADPRKRAGRVFIDYLRNGRGTTAVGPYSPRARPGFPIAAPVSWRQVENGVGPEAYTMGRPFDAAPRRRK
jgi:bifunctional non-homologous end joining protein LigD